LADPNAAGFLFSKGSANIFDRSDADKSTPVVVALSGQILPDSTLLIMYQFTDNKVMMFNVANRLDCEKWVSVTITSDYQSKLRVYVDGECLGIVDMPEIRAFHETEKVPLSLKPIVFKNKHDVAMMNVWIDSAVNQSANDSHLLFSDIVNLTSIPIYDEKDFPGKSCSSVLVSPQCLMNIKSSHLSEDIEVAKLVGQPFTASEINELSQSTTRFPWYIGHPPSFYSSTLATNPIGANLLMKSFSVFDSALSIDVIKSINKISLLDLPDNWSEIISNQVDELSVLNVFGILRRSLSNLDSFNDSSMRQCFANCGIITMLCGQFKARLPTIRIAAFQLASHIFPAMDIELVDENAARCGFKSTFGGSLFLGYLCDSIGQGFNIWRNRAAQCNLLETHPSDTNHSLDVDHFAVLFAQLHLLRAFGSGRMEWQEQLSFLLQSLIELATNSVVNIKLGVQRSFQTIHEDDILKFPIEFEQANSVYSFLAIFGGSPLGKLGAGSRVMYVDTLSGLSESATVLGPAAVPSFDLCDKDAVNRWSAKGSSQVCDALAILLDSDPNKYQVVPAHSVQPNIDSTVISTGLCELVKDKVGLEKLFHLFEELLSIDITDPRPSFEPLEIIVDEEKHFESEHPYPDSKELTESISFEGADKLEIVFDSQSRTEDGCDFVQFFEDNSRKNPVSGKFMGRNGTQNFPGFEDRSPLIIPSSSTFMYFYSDSSGNVSFRCAS
jgi:hypothetical protein